MMGVLTGETYDGSLDLEVRGRRWTKRQNPPLYLHLLDRRTHWLAMPTDQSGGLRAGDRHRVRLQVGDRARLHWLPPAATLFHAGTSTRISELETRIQLEQGSHLQFCPRASVPCSGARIRQTTEVDLERGADFLFWDAWTNGRSASGEEWKFAHLENKLRLSLGGRLVFQDHWILDATSMAPWLPNGEPLKLWFLGLAQGQAQAQALRRHWEALLAGGGWGEMGTLDEDLFVARYAGVRAWDPQGMRRPGESF